MDSSFKKILLFKRVIFLSFISLLKKFTRFFKSSLKKSNFAFLTTTFSCKMLMLLSFELFRRYFIGEFLFFFLLYFLTMNSTLIYGFSIYFIFFHSILSIKDQVNYIYEDDKSKYIKKYLINALPYFLLALFFLVGFYFFIDIESINILPIIFTFLAAITFPHVIVIEKMYSTMK